ncbi:MAG: gliding motility-associated C-terminal domain-containing protein, partial [Flavobacteriia bacterium]|nr:gliding motility-associated C-terminal domain-containing protein [Flavobacteriia bacterium]
PSAVAGGLFDPATMNAGDYTYTVQGNAPCPADAAVVSVSVMSAPDAGTPGAIALCTSDKPVSLFDALGGTPDIGGSWNGPSSVAGGQFDPATMAAGTYTYTISVPPPCADASSAVEVTLETPPDAGHDGTLTLCITGAPAALFGALGGTPDAGGSWSGPGTVVDGLFDPGSMPPGDYTYTVEGTSPCPGDMAVVSVGVVEVPHAGTNGVLNLCSSGDPLDLFPALGDGADPNGSWTPPNGGTFDGTFIPGMSVPGEYTYTVAGGPPCPSASAFLSVNVVDNADAGGDGDLSLCSSNDAVNLFTRLQGAPNTGGSWFLPNGGMFNGLFDPQGHPSGTYTYVVAVPLPCVNDTAQVVVQVEQAVSAGTDTSIVLCNTDGVISLNAQLGGTPDEVGSWTGPEGPSSMAFHPGIDPPGDYTYLVVGTPPCPNASATVSIAVNPMPDAGLDGSLSICPEAAAVSLFSVLNGGPQTGGTWTGPNGLPHAGLFDPSVDAPGPYTYTVPGSAPCPNDQASATMVIHVVPAPHAGNDMVSCSYAGNLAATGTWATGSWGSITPGAVITDPGSASTPVTVNTGGSYTFVWNTISAEGCVSADSVSIVFTGPIIPEVATTPATCHGSCDGEATVTATGGNVGAGGYHYTWPAGTSANGAHSTGYCAGDHLVTVLDTNNCAAMAGFTILQPEPLAIAEVAPSNTLCPESCDGTILVNDPQGVLFSINGGPFQEANLFSGLCPGTYSITMLDAHGCGAGTTAVVASPPPVVAGFSVHPDTVAMNDPVVELTNTSSANATHYLWQFGDGQESGEVNPVHAFPMGIETVYTICLTATTDNGCPDTYCARLPVVGLPGIFVPNAFTPDQDGRNDIFRVAGSRIASDHFELLIFNRWGECIYTATDPGSGWDGTFHGREVTPDVYVWKLVFRFQGEIENRELRGHVTVVR